MSKGTCMCFNKAIVQNMFKHVASENGPLVLILQSYSQIFIVKHIDWDLVELIWTIKNCQISSVSGLVTKLSDQSRSSMNYETLQIRKEKNCPTGSFFNLINRQMCIKINRKVAFFIKFSRTKRSKYWCHPPFHPPSFCRHSLKLLSSTLPKLMNWILLSPPPLSSDPDNPPKFGTCTQSFPKLQQPSWPK